jgi:hypothetical protein
MDSRIHRSDETCGEWGPKLVGPVDLRGRRCGEVMPEAMRFAFPAKAPLDLPNHVLVQVCEAPRTAR